LPKRSKVELRVDQKFQIIEYYQKHPSLKQTELIKHFNKITTLKKITNVDVYFLPPNTTSVIQPCDQGIIRVFKANYRYLLSKFCVRNLEIKDELVMPNVKEAIYMIKEAWDKVSRETIVNCWRHAGNIL
jgi:hypothetical protein